MTLDEWYKYLEEDERRWDDPTMIKYMLNSWSSDVSKRKELQRIQTMLIGYYQRRVEELEQTLWTAINDSNQRLPGSSSDTSP